MSRPEPTIDPARQSRQRQLSNRALVVIGALSLAASLYVGRAFVLDVLTAGFLAVLVTPAKIMLRRRFGRHPALFSLLLTLGVLLLIVIPVAVVVFLILDQSARAIDLIRENLWGLGITSIFSDHLPPSVTNFIDRLNTYVPITIDQLRDELHSLSALVAPTVANIISFSGRSLFSVFVMLMALFFFFMDGERLVAWLEDVLPLELRYSRELFAEFRNVSQAMVFGSVITSVVCGVAASFGYWLFGVPSPFVWGALTGMSQVAPALGSALIWVPLSVFMLLMGQVSSALLTAGYCAVVLGIGIDNILRPLIVGRTLTLHPLLIFIGILGGVTTFGLPGLVVGPMVLAFCTTTLRIYRRDFVPPPEARSPGTVLDPDAVAAAALKVGPPESSADLAKALE